MAEHVQACTFSLAVRDPITLKPARKRITAVVRPLSNRVMDDARINLRRPVPGNVCRIKLCDAFKGSAAYPESGTSGTLLPPPSRVSISDSATAP